MRAMKAIVRLILIGAPHSEKNGRQINSGRFIIEKPGSSRSSVPGLPQIPRVTSPNRNLIGSACRMEGWSEMTPEEELIQRYFDAFNRHDLDGVMACFDSH